MTLTQLSAFVLVARLGSVKEAASVLGVSEPAVSQALTALRQHFGDQLIERTAEGMVLTPGGARLAPIASQMVGLGTEAESAVRSARGAPDQLRVVATNALAEFIATPVVEAFTARLSRPVEATVGVTTHDQLPVLIASRLADAGIWDGRAAAPGVAIEAIFRYELIAVTSAQTAARGDVARLPWLVDPSGTDPASEVTALLQRLEVAAKQVRVFPNQTAAWAAAAEGAGIAPAIAHLVAPRIQRGELCVVATPATPMQGVWSMATLPSGSRSAITGTFQRFLKTPEALHILRRPDAGVPVARFRPPVRVTIWN